MGKNIWSTWGFGSSVCVSEGFRYGFDLFLALFVVDVLCTPFGDEIVFKFPVVVSMEAEA